MRCALLASLLCGACVAAAQPADIVFFNGRVITVDPADRVAQALAVRGERILAVGDDATVLALAGEGTRRIDLAGRALTPGLIDAHNHFLDAAVARYELVDVGFPAVRDVADLLGRVGQRADGVAGEGWVIGRGWDEGKLAERRYPQARELDTVSGGHPVWLTHATGHYGVANGRALALAGIDRHTPDPPHGTIDRDASGAPTGVLKESAMALVTRLLPARTALQRERSVERLAKEFGAECMTAAKDPGISDEDWAAYRAVHERGALPLRIAVLWSGGTTEQQARALIAAHAADTRPWRGTGDDRLFAAGVKLFMDGSGGARTAWMWQDWNRNRTETDTGNTGYPAADPEELRRMIRLYHDAGMPVAVHAVGDRAIDWTVGSFAAALAANPVRGLRHSIVHANIPTEAAMDTMARLQREFDAAYPEPSATFTWYIGDVYAANFGERARRLNPFASFLRKGILWANGSDFDVTPFPARYGIWAAVARRTLLDAPGDPFGRAEAVDVHAALRAVTRNAAHQLFLDGSTGSLEPGKYADVAVWDRDPYTVPTDALQDLRCEMTLLAGRVVFETPAEEMALSRRQ